MPGACIHDGDYGFSANSGVQFVFGGNSHVNLKSGALELCPSFSSTHQEIVMYGVRSTSSGSQVGPITWKPTSSTNGSPGFTNPGNAVTGTGATAALTSGTPTRTHVAHPFLADHVPGAARQPDPAGLDDHQRHALR